MRVLVTGGAKRLGKYLCEAFAAKGDSVVVHYNASSHEADELIHTLRAHGTDACSVQKNLSDITSTEQARQFLESIESTAGPIDVLINSGSLFEYDEPSCVDTQLSQRCFQVNTIAPICLMHACIVLNLTRDAVATVVNVLDVKLLSLNPDYFSYTLSKGMLANATTMTAMHYLGKAKVYAVAPAMFAESGAPTAGRVDELVRTNPVAHAVSFNDVSNTIVYLAQGYAQTGQMIPVDAGQALMQLPRDVAFLSDKPQ